MHKTVELLMLEWRETVCFEKKRIERLMPRVRARSVLHVSTNCVLRVYFTNPAPLRERERYQVEGESRWPHVCVVRVLSDEDRQKSNEFFKEQKYPEAVKHYSEAIKRNPKDAKAYSNRAACYTKLGAMPEGLKDAEKCIELDPTFVKGYSRKGAIQFFMKEYDKALETYQEGLKHEPQNQELLDGIRRCVQQINKASRGDLSPEEMKERQAKAMQDPEIQNILTDPVMRQVLVDFQENPKAAQEHSKNPAVMDKIQKLVSAGIVQIK